MEQQSEERQLANNGTSSLKSPKLSSSNVDDVESLIHDDSNIDLAGDPHQRVPRDDEMRYSRVPPYTIQPIKVRPNYSLANNFRVRVPELKTFESPSNKYRSTEQPTVESDHFDDQVNRLHHFEDQRSLWERERSEPVVIRARYFDDDDDNDEEDKDKDKMEYKKKKKEIPEPLEFRSRYLDVKRGYPMRERFESLLANESHCETVHDYYGYGMPMPERLKPDFQPESTAKEYPKSDPYHRDEIGKTAPLGGRNEIPGGKNEVTSYDEFDNYELDWSIEKGRERKLKEEQGKLLRRKKKTEKTNRSECFLQ